MKKSIVTSFAVLALSGGSLFAGTINWSVAQSAGTFSNGDPLPTGFTFEVGTFGGGFSPDGSNTVLWTENFLTGGLTSPTGVWTNADAPEPFEAFGSADGSTVLRPDGEVTAGAQGYLWGYNSLDHVGSSEWILFTNPDWTFPQATPEGGIPIETVSFGTSNPGTLTLFGSSNHTTDSGQDAAMSTQAIPEPSTYALIFGLGILGFLGFRRFRK